MQNRYTGDIGDFSKLGLLRALQAAGLSVGLNWYLTPDETHNSDGRHVNYLYQDEYRKCDEELWLGLKAIVGGETREVRYMENESILPATFFSDCIDFRGKKKAEGIERRAEWFAKSLGEMSAKTSCAWTRTTAWWCHLPWEGQRRTSTYCPKRSLYITPRAPRSSTTSTRPGGRIPSTPTSWKRCWEEKTFPKHQAWR